MSIICSFIFTYSNLICLSYTNSLKKWYLIAMCFVLVSITRFFDIFIALVLSQYMTTRSLISTFIPSNNYLNQSMLEQFTTTATYSASTMDWDVQFYFFLVQDTIILPRKNARPLVLLLSSRLLSQLALVNTFKFRFPLSLYHKS